MVADDRDGGAAGNTAQGDGAERDLDERTEVSVIHDAVALDEGDVFGILLAQERRHLPDWD